ncbi:MAG: L-threonylcarbamoyladenylate synthase [Dongiaceae bacterium]
MTVAAKIVSGDEAGLRAAARVIAKGGLVAVPTETVYGLAGDATNDRAVARIFEVKARPQFNPLIVHVADRSMAAKLVSMNRVAERLADAFWPGPLTLVLPRRRNASVSLLASAGLETLAIRMPAHPIALDLIRLSGRPLAAPSANPSGRLTPTEATHVAASLGDRIDLILDGGPCAIGIESTVLDLSEATPRILRQGGLPQNNIEALVGEMASGSDIGPIRSPGMTAGHYAPSIGLRMDATSVEAAEALLAFGAKPLPGAATTLNLSVNSDLIEAAANFFSMLHRLDDRRYSRIAVMPVPETGLGGAINDRLRRAAAGDARSRGD